MAEANRPAVSGEITFFLIETFGNILRISRIGAKKLKGQSI